MSSREKRRHPGEHGRRTCYRKRVWMCRYGLGLAVKECWGRRMWASTYLLFKSAAVLSRGRHRVN